MQREALSLDLNWMGSEERGEEEPGLSSLTTDSPDTARSLIQKASDSGDSRRVELVGYEKVIEEPWPCVRVSP